MFGSVKMSLTATCESQKRSLSSLLAGRVVKKLKPEDEERLQEEVIQLLEQQQDLGGLFAEAANSDLCNIFSVEQKQASSQSVSPSIAASLLAGELQRRAAQLGVPTAMLSAKTLLERLREVTEEEEEEEEERQMLRPAQRARLGAALESSRELLSQGVLCPALLWQELHRHQKLLKLEVVHHLQVGGLLTLRLVLESDEEVGSWLASQMKALCDWTPPREEEETGRVQREVLSGVVGVLVAAGFEAEAAAADRRVSLLCCSLLDGVLSWLLDAVDSGPSAEAAAHRWIAVFAAPLGGVSASPEARRRFFSHSLTQTLTYKPRLTVSDAVGLQSEWTFAKASGALTALLRKLSVVFSVDQLLLHLHQVLETHEVNWKHVLCLCSTLLVYYSSAQTSLRELLSRLLSTAFESYDLENMITAFLLARQGALEGPAVFLSYSDWFKMCFGGGDGFHASSKKSLVFLLKFLSDLVPYDPPQYLKVHILHPPFVPVKHRSLLMEYVSLAKTRLADLKESVEDMGLYEDVSTPCGSVQPQCQAVQDVVKAVSLFESTGRISAAVMEASIFRRTYFLTRFLPALLKPRVLPLKPDARMSFIDALKKAEKIPAAQFSSYSESCDRERRRLSSAASSRSSDEPLELLKVQLQEATKMMADGDDEETSAQLSRISQTLSVVFPGRLTESTVGQMVLGPRLDAPPSSELHLKTVGLILRSFCQRVLDASRVTPPNRQGRWASMFVLSLLGNTQLLSCLQQRLADLLRLQASSLSPAHLLGVAVFLVHLHAAAATATAPPRPLESPAADAVTLALVCRTRGDMSACVRLCVAAVCYGLCRGHNLPQQQQQQLVPSSLYKKLLYLIPRLLPEARRTPPPPAPPAAPPAAPPPAAADHDEEEENPAGLWSSATDSSHSWRETARQLWRHAGFQQLQREPQYQLSLSEWLSCELSVQRGEDALTDAERQEYQQWACWELYLTRPQEQGGCSGDVRILCSHLLAGIMEQQLSDQTASDGGTCLPDVLSRLQEVVCELQLSAPCRSDLCDLLFEAVSRRCSSSDSLGLQRTLHAWNRVLLSLPAAAFVGLKAEGGRTTLSCDRLMEHVNRHQRNVCSPAGLLPFHLTAHLLRGLLCAAERCGRPADEVDRAWTQIADRCPLLLVSTAHWWPRLFPALSSTWRRLRGEASLPQQLQLVADCERWTRRLEEEEQRPPQAPPAAASALLLAASLHRPLRDVGGGRRRSLSAALKCLRPEGDAKHRQALVFLFFLSVNDFLSALLRPQDHSREATLGVVSELLAALVGSSDWLLVFGSHERGVYQPATTVTTEASTRLLPWAFCSLLLHQPSELLQRASRCSGFLHIATCCYISTLQLFLDGQTPPPPPGGDASEEQTETLRRTKQFLLRAVAQAPPTALSSSQLRQLEALCADVDPEVAAALSVHFHPGSLSPEMDFL